MLLLKEIIPEDAMLHTFLLCFIHPICFTSTVPCLFGIFRTSFCMMVFKSVAEVFPVFKASTSIVSRLVAVVTRVPSKAVAICRRIDRKRDSSRMRSSTYFLTIISDHDFRYQMFSSKLTSSFASVRSCNFFSPFIKVPPAPTIAMILAVRESGSIWGSRLATKLVLGAFEGSMAASLVVCDLSQTKLGKLLRVGSSVKL